MAEHDETNSKADSKRTFESASPFYKNPDTLNRDLPTLKGLTVKGPVAPAIGAKDDAHPAAPAASDPSAKPANGEEVNHPAPAAPARRGLSPVAAAVVALIGAASGFAAAYAARMLLDDTQKTAASFEQRFNALDGKLAADEKKIETSSSASRDAIAMLEKRLTAAEKSAKDALASASQIETTKTAAAEVPPGTSAAPAPAVDLTPLQTRIDAIDQRLTKIEATVNAPKTAQRATTQEPDSKPDPKIANAPVVAIIAENLVSKIASGAPYSAETAALEKLGVDKAKLAILQASATKGLITAHALLDEFTALVPALTATEKPPAPQGNVVDRLISHATGLVHVRKVGDVTGEDIAAHIARVQNALAKDDTEGALREWDTFSDAAKGLSSQWAADAKTRTTTLAAARAIVSEAMANLVKVKS